MKTVFNIQEVRRMYADLFNTPRCNQPGHGNETTKICVACGRVACVRCEPDFCQCQVKKEEK